MMDFHIKFGEQLTQLLHSYCLATWTKLKLNYFCAIPSDTKKNHHHVLSKILLVLLPYFQLFFLLMFRHIIHFFMSSYYSIQKSSFCWLARRETVCGILSKWAEPIYRVSKYSHSKLLSVCQCLTSQQLLQLKFLDYYYY